LEHALRFEKSIGKIQIVYMGRVEVKSKKLAFCLFLVEEFMGVLCIRNTKRKILREIFGTTCTP
jgi:hypothetical protein